MKVSFLRSYRSEKGNQVFVYTVSGKAEALEAFQTAQGEFYRETEEGAPLWFTTRYIGENGMLIITSTGNIVPDMSELEKQKSLVEQAGGDFGQALANAAAANFLGSSPAPASTPQPAEKTEDQGGDLGEV